MELFMESERQGGLYGEGGAGHQKGETKKVVEAAIKKVHGAAINKVDKVHGAAINKVDELFEKLKRSKQVINGMLDKAAPKVDIPMPKLSPSMFGGAESDQVPLLAVGSSEQDVQETVGASKAKAKAAEVRKKALEAQKQAQEAQQEMAEEAKNAMAKQMGAGKQVLAQTLAAAMSVAVGVAISFAPLGPFAGQILAGVAASLLNFLGLAKSWANRSTSIFQVLNKVFDRVTNNVAKILETVDDMIMGPLEKLESAIEDMTEEQKPTLDNMKKFQSAMRMADPNFDVPDPEDLKKPLVGCENMIEDFVDKAKKEVPEKLAEMIQSTTLGRIATDESLFNYYVVMLPLVVVFLFDVILAVGQVWLMFSPKDIDQHQAGVATRRLRGSASFLPKDVHLPKEMALDNLMPYIQPALVQVAMVGLQMIGALCLSTGPRICDLVNGAIAMLGEKVNESVNARIKSAVDKVFGEAFGNVKSISDQFFPKFEAATIALKKAMETAGKAGAMANGAMGGLFESRP